jgi:O-antigen biosynthesis protein
LKILSVLLNQFGSAYYRQYVPMQALMDAGYKVTIIDEPTVPRGTLEAHDVVQLSRVAGLDTTVAVERIKWMQNLGLKVVIDYDDDLLHIPAHNPAYEDTNPDAVIQAIRAADAITVSTSALASVYKSYAKKIGIIPNYIDVKNWPNLCPPADKITIGLVGSASHHDDWRMIEQPMRRIMETYDVNFLVAGYLPEYLKDIITEFVPWTDVFTYQATVNRIDIGLCPLTDDGFNRRKTFIKALEYGMAGAAVVASPTLYRDIVQGRGLIVRDEQGWYDAIEALIVSPALRKQHAKALHECVVSRWGVRKHTTEIYQTYRSLFKSPGVLNGTQRDQRAARI